MTQTATLQTGWKARLGYLAVLLVFVAGSFSFYGFKTGIFTSQADNIFLAANDVPETAQMDVFLETGRKTRELQTDLLQVRLPDDLRQSLAAPYRINATVKLPENKYRDFSFTVTKNDIAVIADGFHADDLVTLALNDHTAFERIPMDWSGKLELNTVLPQEKTVRACIYITGKSDTFGLCHTLAERRTL